MEQLSLEECRTILESLDYSRYRISEYHHDKYEYKLASLDPIYKCIAKVQLIRNELKRDMKIDKKEISKEGGVK